MAKINKKLIKGLKRQAFYFGLVLFQVKGGPGTRHRHWEPHSHQNGGQLQPWYPWAKHTAPAPGSSGEGYHQ